MHSQVGPRGSVTEVPKKAERLPPSPKLASLKKGKLLFQQSYVNLVKLVHWVAELALGGCHNIDGELVHWVAELALGGCHNINGELGKLIEICHFTLPRLLSLNKTPQ